MNFVPFSKLDNGSKDLKIIQAPEMVEAQC